MENIKISQQDEIIDQNKIDSKILSDFLEGKIKATTLNELTTGESEQVHFAVERLSLNGILNWAEVNAIYADIIVAFTRHARKIMQVDNLKNQYDNGKISFEILMSSLKEILTTDELAAFFENYNVQFYFNMCKKIGCKKPPQALGLCLRHYNAFNFKRWRNKSADNKKKAYESNKKWIEKNREKYLNARRKSYKKQKYNRIQ